MSELPQGWATEVLGRACDVVRGITFPSSAKEFKKTATNVCCLRTTNIQREVEWGDVYFVSQEFVKRDDQFVQVGDVLMSMANSYELVGKIAVVRSLPYQTAFGAFLSAVRPKPVIHGQFLFYFLRSDRVQREIREGSSQTTNIANVSVGRLSEIETPIPPFSEQKRIADKLDTVLARVDVCRERLDRLPIIFRRFRQAVLKLATSGGLTTDWRNSRRIGGSIQQILMEEDSVPIPSTWKVQTIYEVIDPSRPLCYGVVQPGEKVQGGAMLIRVQDMDRWGVLTNNLRTVSSAIDAEYRRSRVRSGDLLVSVVGTIGRTAIVPDGIEANIARAVARVACRADVSSTWVNYWLSSDPLQWWLSRSSREVARKTLNLSELGATQVAVPPKEEQAEIIRRAESLFAYADTLEARYTAARAQVDRLAPALIAKAFRGELVPQDPNDEPAGVLLTRIGASQGDSSLKTLKTRRGPGRPRKISRTEVSMLNRKDISRAHLSAILIMHGPVTAESLWSASQLEIDDFYDQLKDEEALGLLREVRSSDGVRQLEAVE